MTPKVALDKFERVAWDCSFATAIVGNPHANDYELIELGLGKMPLSEETLQNFQRRNFSFLGIIGIYEGRPCTALDFEPAEDTVRALCRTFLKLLEREPNTRAIKQVAKRAGDEVEWLNRLQTLPDLRKGMEN